jgi:hypothetical protein
MEANRLAAAWREATDELRLPADFVDRVVRGGRRRAAHRRGRIVAGVATVALIVAGVALVGIARGGPTATPSDPRLEEPTHGDLATDQAFIDRAVRAWRDGIKVSYNADRGIFDDPRSAPHVYWAGTTPAGPAAVVLQRFYLHEHDNLSSTDANETQTLVGLVGSDPAGNRLALVGDQYRADGFPEPGYFLFGPGDRTVLVLRRDVPVYLSTRPVLDQDGRTTRQWQRLAFTDSVAVAQIPAEDDPDAVRLVARTTAPEPDVKTWDGLLLLERASVYLQAAADIRAGRTTEFDQRENRLQWLEYGPPVRVGQDPPAMDHPDHVLNEALHDWGTIDLGLSTTYYGLWCVVAGLPDGNVALVSEVQQDDRPSRVYAVITDRAGTVLAVRPGNVVDLTAALPVVVRLPDGQGWVVASYGRQLAYRSAGGDWTPAGAHAALLPDVAAEVRVTDPTGTTADVPLASR